MDGVFYHVHRSYRRVAHFHQPTALFWSAVTGVVLALSFFVTRGLGIVRVVYVVFNTIAASLACAVSFRIVTHLPTGINVVIPFFWRIVVIDGVPGAVFALITGAFVRLKIQVEDTQTKLRLQELAVRELAVTASQAQARALQSQINPHFSFNTLNTIFALIEDDPAAARQMIGRLADLFRYVPGCSHADAVTLCEGSSIRHGITSPSNARVSARDSAWNCRTACCRISEFPAWCFSRCLKTPSNTASRRWSMVVRFRCT